MPVSECDSLHVMPTVNDGENASSTVNAVVRPHAGGFARPNRSRTLGSDSLSNKRLSANDGVADEAMPASTPTTSRTRRRKAKKADKTDNGRLGDCQVQEKSEVIFQGSSLSRKQYSLTLIIVSLSILACHHPWQPSPRQSLKSYLFRDLEKIRSECKRSDRSEEVALSYITTPSWPRHQEL